MLWKIITVGQPSLRWARDAVQDYESRIRRYTRLEIQSLAANRPQTVGERMLKQSADSYRIALHESGKRFTSRDLASWIDRQQLQATKSVALCIGGADGHGQDLLDSARECWSLSDFTLQHELALVVLMEQLYRAHTILRGEPYHRD
jgi:23S rRNA (pseudouridine1915-N3)-methyltransferase